MIPTTLDEAMTMIECCGPSVAVTIADRLHEMPRETERRFLVIVTPGPGWQFCEAAPTRLDALRGVIEQMQRAAEEEIARRERRPAATPDDRQIALL